MFAIVIHEHASLMRLPQSRTSNLHSLPCKLDETSNSQKFCWRVEFDCFLKTMKLLEVKQNSNMAETPTPTKVVNSAKSC